MRLTGQAGNFGPYPDWEGGEKLLRRAVELGVNFIDTAEAYGSGFRCQLKTLPTTPSDTPSKKTGGQSPKILTTLE